MSRIFLAGLALAAVNANAATLPLASPDLKIRSSGCALAALVQQDGKLVVGGAFDEAGGVRRIALARLDTDGTVDAGWTPPSFGSPIFSMATSADAVYLGLFPFGGIAKIPLGSDGTADSTFGIAASSLVHSMVVDDGHLFTVTLPGDVTRRDLTTGAVDASWTSAVRGMSLATDRAGHLYVGTQRIDIVTGAADPDWNPPSTPAGVTATALGEDGYLYVASPGPIGTGGVEGLARLQVDANGAIDAAWHPVAPGDAAHGEFDAILPRGGDSVYVGGQFERIGGAQHANFARLSGPSGTADPSWSADADGPVYALAALPSGTIVATGCFTLVGGEPRASVAGVMPSGAIDPAVSSRLYGGTGNVLAITPDPASGRVYVGGQFDWVGEERHRGLLRLQPDGSLDAGWTPGIDDASEPPGYGDRVSAIAVAAGKVYIAGQFGKVNGQARRNVARIAEDAPGTLDPDWNPDVRGSSNFPDDPGSDVVAIAIDAAGRAIIGGDFNTVGGVAQAGLARIAANGSFDPSWRPQPPYPVYGFVHDGANATYVRMGTPGSGSTPTKVWMDSGTFDTAWNEAAAMIQADDMLLADGSLYVAGAAPATTVLRIDTASGAIDPAWQLALGDCGARRLARDADGNFFVAGNEFVDTTIPCMHRFAADGSRDPSFAPAWLAYEAIEALAADAHGRIYVGGPFSTVSGIPRSVLAAFAASSLFTDGFDP